MRRTNATVLKVNAPSKGLLTRLPPDLQDDGKAQHLTRAENVRAENGELAAAPGYERVHLGDKGLDSPANLLHQPNLTSADAEVRNMPIVGTETTLYTMRKRSRNLVCPVDCTLRFAAVADSGRHSGPSASVAKLVRSWAPDVVVHAGDLVYADGGTPEGVDIYESQVAQHYWWALGGYTGPAGKGPATNNFLPTPGNHDYVDGPLARYGAFFGRSERYYTVKRGPVQFFFIDSNGYGPVAPGPGGENLAGTGMDPGTGSADLSSTGPQAQWLQAELAASDCPWRIVLWHHPPHTSQTGYHPGYSVMDWPLGAWGADMLITGHSHVYERIHRPDGVVHLTVGLGGQSVRGFVETPLPTSVARYAGSYGALRVDVGSDTIVGKFYDLDGNVQDSFTLSTERPLSLCYRGGLNRGQATKFEVTPPSVDLPSGVPFPLRAVATYLDGSSADVTQETVWDSADTGIASVTAAGEVMGNREGSTTVTGTYQGLYDTTVVNVLSECTDLPCDIALVLDRSDSMLYAEPPAGTRIDRLKVAANLFLSALKPTDRVATVSFATTATLHHGLTHDHSRARRAVAELVPTSRTGIWEAVTQATDELTARARPDAKKILILFTDGIANEGPSCTTGGAMGCGTADATAACEAAKAAGITVMVVALDIMGWSYFVPIVESWASCPELFWPVQLADELLPVFVRLRQHVCVGLCSSGEGVGIGLI